MAFTAEQLRAIQARGNTLVLAGAGSGKTRTLVERCARLLLDPEHPISVRNILIVTFNEAAAAEVRERLRRRLEEERTARAAQQIAELDSAQISTLHSFCYTLVREHFYELDLDPAVAVLDDAQAQVLFLSTIEELLIEHYTGKHSFSGALKDYIRTHLRGWEKPLIQFVRKVHEFTQTRPDPERWFDRQFAILSTGDCAAWKEWHCAAVREWCAWWIPWLRQLPEANANAHACAALLAASQSDPAVLPKILERRNSWVRGKTDEHRKPFEHLFKEAEFLESVRGDAPLQQDWEWSRPVIELLLQFARQFAQRFATVKLERCVLDFHDLEQGALRLLWKGDEPTEIATQWRAKFAAVFVDEYQDINAAQDRIIRAVSAQNRFLVGDNKQSIYRFRQADPAIFQTYLNEPTGWERAYLSENFRSHEGILNFINPLFSWLMQRAVGGVDYDARATLRFGESDGRELLRAASTDRQVELHLTFSDSAAADDEDLSDVEREARLVALRLRELRQSGLQIAENGAERPVEWRDMVVLLRAASNKLEIYAKAFESAGVPLHTKQNAFYTTQEVLDLFSLLTILDNPWQDIPLVAVLRSPLCGMNASELAAVRTASEARPFWRALHQFYEKKKDGSAWAKLDRFLARYEAWRGVHSSASLSQRLERILEDTGYDQWLLTQPRGAQRYANVQQFLRVARHFDESRGESLYQFILHLRELQDAVGDIEPAVATQENAVRLMTVHQSKGLEFPVVAAPDLGKRFNNMDQTSSLLIDDEFGVCGLIKPPEAGAQYPSLPLWLARRNQRVATLGEEIRLMYVAFTRAQNHLLLFGTTGEKRATKKWSDYGVERPMPHHVLKASSWLDWLGFWASSVRGDWLGSASGDVGWCRYRIHRSVSEVGEPNAPQPPELRADSAELLSRLNFQYRHQAATREAAKTSVSTLRRRREEQEESRLISFRTRAKGDGQSRGIACHTFLEHIALDRALDGASLARQAEEMVEHGILRRDERELLDLDGIAQFWNGKTGSELLAQRPHLKRELPFTCKLTRRLLEKHALPSLLDMPDEEFVVLQGIADLVMLGPEEIWLIDFKTDEVRTGDLMNAANGYRTQIELYSLALEAIYARPVRRKGLYFVQPRELVWL